MGILKGENLLKWVVGSVSFILKQTFTFCIRGLQLYSPSELL